jgi:2-phosphosulfolactate phosphatase
MVLGQSRVGKMLEEYGFREEITFISNRDCFCTVPVLIGDELVDFNRIKVSSN